MVWNSLTFVAPNRYSSCLVGIGRMEGYILKRIQGEHLWESSIPRPSNIVGGKKKPSSRLFDYITQLDFMKEMFNFYNKGYKLDLYLYQLLSLQVWQSLSFWSINDLKTSFNSSMPSSPQRLSWPSCLKIQPLATVLMTLPHPTAAPPFLSPAPHTCVCLYVCLSVLHSLS